MAFTVAINKVTGEFALPFSRQWTKTWARAWCAVDVSKTSIGMVPASLPVEPLSSQLDP